MIYFRLSDEVHAKVRSSIERQREREGREFVAAARWVREAIELRLILEETMPAVESFVANHMRTALREIAGADGSDARAHATRARQIAADALAPHDAPSPTEGGPQ